MSSLETRARKLPSPPSGFESYLSRRQAAEVLGLASEFKVRQLEKEGRLRPVRGVMGSAWYPRAEVMALRPLLARSAPSTTRRSWSDGELLALLRQAGPGGQPRTVADLIVETGTSIARAEKVYRFWLAKDLHPMAALARGETVPAAPAPVPAASVVTVTPAERRGSERLLRADLIRKLRDPDPLVRAAAYDRLRTR